MKNRKSTLIFGVEKNRRSIKYGKEKKKTGAKDEKN